MNNPIRLSAQLNRIQSGIKQTNKQAMNFNLDWDEPDIWSTHQSTTTQPSSPTNQSDSSELTTTIPTTIQSTNSNSNQSSTLSISTDLIPKPFIRLDSNTQSSPTILFSSPSDASSTQSMFSATADHHQSPSQPIQFDGPITDDDEFGEFDDGDEFGQGGEGNHDEFGEFDRIQSLSLSPKPIPITKNFEIKSKIISFNLPNIMNYENLKQSITPAIDSLFTTPIDSSSSSSSSSPWITNQSIQISKHQVKNSTIPLILNDNELIRSIWNELIENQNGLGISIDWKRSQIRRHFLVTLGIPVDLNDFLTPTDLPKQKLSLHTNSTSSNLLHPFNSNLIKSSIKSPNPTISIDRKRCNELLSLDNQELKKKSDEDLIKIRDELKKMNKTISDLLSHSLTKRDKLNQDSDSYNTMISDLITAAQRIKMGSPNMNKRSSSIQLGSSSITSTNSNSNTSRWFTNSSNRSINPTINHSSKSIEFNPKRSSVL